MADRVVTDEAFDADWLRFRDDAPADEPAVSLDGFLEQDNASSVRIEAGEDVEQLIPHLDRLRLIEIDFPKFRDGRGFSTARSTASTTPSSSKPGPAIFACVVSSSPDPPSRSW